MIHDRRVQYETAGLDVDDVDRDPMVQWQQWHADAFEVGVAEPNAMTLGTVDADGTPDARIVLVRGADEHGFAFFTNYSSVKSRQLEALARRRRCSAGSICTVRFGCAGASSGSTTPSSDAYFASRPRPSQIGAWASPQSEVIADRAELERLVAAVEERFAGSDVPRPPHWGGWLLVPEVFEFWQGRPSRLHDRLRYHRAGDTWQISRLAP